MTHRIQRHRVLQPLARAALALLAQGLIATAFAQSDYGDAPLSYGTLSINNGPSHFVFPGFSLGASADTEVDGQPGALAAGDDNAGADDEDGVQIYSSALDRIVGAQIGAWSQLQVTVRLNFPGQAAYLNAWVDFNSDGDFADAGERILANVLAAEGLNEFGFFTPLTAPPGATYARVRLGNVPVAGPGGFGGNGEVEDYRLEFTRASSASNVQAHERFGQRWITWEFNPAAPAQAYEVYWSPLPMATIASGTLVARLFPDDYCGPRLVKQLVEAFGTNAANLNFTIPNAVGSGTTTLANNQGLCVETIRAVIPAGYYAVVPRGQVGVPAASLSALVPLSVAGIGDANRPKPHLQQSGLVNNNNHLVAFYTFWADGDDNSAAGRADFPVMGNFARRGLPHHFMFVSPSPAPTNGPQPLALSLHGGNGTATHWLPGGTLWNKEGGHATNGYSIGLEDRVPQIVRGRPQAVSSRWLGWVATWDPFENSPPLPPNGDYIQPYTLTRLNWLLDWVLNHSDLNLDSPRVAVRGMSLGSVGAMLWAHTSPERFSHLTMHVPPLHWGHIWPDREPLYGTDAQNLRIAGLTNASGNPLRFRDTMSLTENLAPDAQPLPTKLFSGKRDEWWSVDYEADFEPDLLQDLRAADLASGALGVQFWWDQRQHEAEGWMLSEAGGSPGACPDFTTNDFWIPTLGTQTRRDDVEAHFRFRNDRSFPAFYRLQDDPAQHGDPGSVEYNGVPFQQITEREGAPYTGVNDPCNRGLPVVTGDRRGTWGGYFDWFTGGGSEALRDEAQQWACSVALVNGTDAGGRSVAAVDNAPTNLLSARLAIRRPQNFTPPAGTPVLWMNADRASGLVTQSGTDEVGPQGVVKLPEINVPRLPNIARVLVATHADFGDAPVGYPVTFAEGGAHHASDSLLRLGTTRNVETNGVHSATALSASEADDGVSGPASWPQNSLVNLSVVANQACRLDAWVDWARNSRWAGTAFDAQDQVAASLALSPGTNLVAVFVPPWAPTGVTFARFRVSSAGGLAPTGPALDGEVEDYPVAVTAGTQTNGAPLLSNYVLPLLTDPALTNYNDPSFVALSTNPALRQGKLLLHLPGSGHEPWQATNFILAAASLGYHAVSIKYQNVPSIASYCTANTNLDCFRLVTEENITGAVWADNDPTAIKQVTRTDSITNRVVKLLTYLATNPATAGQNWSQFLGPQGVQWDKAAVSGHSQGGSGALLLSKMHEVDRAVLFSTVDWIYFPTNSRPAWFAEPGLTPPERLYGFTHYEDFGGSNHEQQPLIWQDLGMTSFGPIMRVEFNTPPFLGSHTLSTRLRPATTNDSGSLEYHASVIIDRAIPTNATGRVTWEPVWSYMLTNVTAPLPALLALTTNGAGGWQASWMGDANYSSQLEHSPNLVAWFQLDVPAQEVNGVMSLEIPPYLLDDPQHFFRLARAPLVTSPIPTAPGFYATQTFLHGDVARNYYLSIPAGWNAATNWPLMLALPGHGQSIAEFANLQQELISLASSNGMILVFAEATTGINSYAWFAYENPNTGQPYIDDAAFLIALLDELKASGLNVNTNRCYLAGFSNGGSMTHYMASVANHPFAAFAIMESGTAPLAHFREPYNRLLPDDGTVVPANIQLPWTPRPVMLMNMATSVPWPFEGRFPIRGARENVSRWVYANGHGAPVTNATLGIIEPPPALLSTNTTWSATGNNRSLVAYEDIRPDHNWPTNLVLNGWSLTNAVRFPYFAESGTNVINQRLPEWVRTKYPHALSPDPAAPSGFVRVDSGTMTVEIWRSDPLNRTNEVIFIGLSDGGHRWPGADDKLPFNANVEVLRFFQAH